MNWLVSQSAVAQTFDENNKMKNKHSDLKLKLPRKMLCNHVKVFEYFVGSRVRWRIHFIVERSNVRYIFNILPLFATAIVHLIRV